MEPRYIQINQPETKKVHYEQANSVLKYKPDIVLLEYPNNNKTPSYLFNNYTPDKKPLEEIEKVKKVISSVLDIHPWAKADITMWDNIIALWEEGHQVLVYKVDGPSELTREMLSVWTGNQPRPDEWPWMAKQYLREKTMTKNLKYVLSKNNKKESPLILVFIQSYHWEHVSFLMKQPSSRKIWNYYFGHLSEITRRTIGDKIKQENEIIYKYWEKYSDFYS